MLRFGVIGTNFISDWFVEASKGTRGMTAVAAVYSRSLERGREFATRHGIPLVFTNLEDMIASVDAVYIASPTAAHFPQAMMAIRGGRHVLVEKTMTVDLLQTHTIFAAAQEVGVVAMEATRSLHAPPHALISDTLGELGTLRYAHLENLQYSSRYDRHKAGEAVNAFDPSLGNSALVDIGVYCLEPALDWFGMPLSQSGESVRLSNGFEALGSIQLAYPDMLVDLVYSKIAQSVTPSVIVGEEGALTIDNLGQPGRIVLERRGEPAVPLLETSVPAPSENMHFEVTCFAEQVAAGHTDPRWRDITIATREIMDRHLRTSPSAAEGRT